MLRFNGTMLFCVYLINYNNTGFFRIFPTIVAIIDHEITLKILEFVLNSIGKVKPVFFTFLNVYIFWIEWDKILIWQLSQMGDTMKMNFDNFKWKNEFPKQLRLEKHMKKNGVICPVFMFLPELWSLNC